MSGLEFQVLTYKVYLEQIYMHIFQWIVQKVAPLISTFNLPLQNSVWSLVIQPMINCVSPHNHNMQKYILSVFLVHDSMLYILNSTPLICEYLSFQLHSKSQAAGNLLSLLLSTFTTEWL